MKRLVSLLLAFIAYLGMGFPHTQAYAESSISYTHVLEDLTKDKSFREKDYPAVADDYSLKVIQIAESVNGELFIYVYQPSDSAKELTATSIRISQSIGENAKWKDYDLTLLNTEGVLDKYRVEGITILSDVVRYYDIAAIYRAFDSDIDDPADTNYDQSINEVVYEVAQEWHACTIDGEVSYSMITSETITITNKIVGYIQYSEGFKLYLDRCDSHFVAFSTDRKIDDLMEADIEYTTQSYIKIVKTGDDTPTLGEKISNSKTVKALEEVSNDADGLFGKKYTWNRIEKVSDFIANEGEDLNLTTGNLEDLKNMDWILRFEETDFTSTVGMYVTNTGTLVSEVTILRLKFQTDGVTYNLGVVDNKQTGNKDPFASADTYLDDLEEGGPNWQVLIAVLALCLLLPILSPLLTALLDLIVWLITAPLKAIKRRKNDKDG